MTSDYFAKAALALRQARETGTTIAPVSATCIGVGVRDCSTRRALVSAPVTVCIQHNPRPSQLKK
jgi:hypothetical protein